MSVFVKLGHVLEDTIYKIDKVFCTMYNNKNIYHQHWSVDEVRLQIF